MASGVDAKTNSISVSSSSSLENATSCEIYNDLAYVYDGTLEGLLSAIFASYANREDPTDVASESVHQPRLGQRISRIETNFEHADRVKRGIREKCGNYAFRNVLKASLSGIPEAGTAAYRFVRYAMDKAKTNVYECRTCRKRESCPSRNKGGYCPKKRGRAISDITHPAVEPLFKVARSVSQEAEHIRQFARFEHIVTDDVDFWFAKINPRDSVVPLVMNHFVERFNIQAFMIYDEIHGLIGVYDGNSQYYAKPDTVEELLGLKTFAGDEAAMQEAWKRFYKVLSVEARYNPELRRSLMPKRFWKNLTEMQEDSQNGLLRLD